MDDKSIQGALQSAAATIERSKAQIQESEEFLREHKRLGQLRQNQMQKELQEIAEQQAEIALLKKKLVAVQIGMLERMVERKPSTASVYTRTPRKMPPRPEKLPAQNMDLSRYFDECKLTDSQREVASLRLEYGLSKKKIAERLGISRPAVDKRLQGAERRLEKCQSLRSALKRQAINRNSDD